MIEINCSCGQKLELADEFAGSVTRCTECEAVVSVPEAQDPTAEPYYEPPRIRRPERPQRPHRPAAPPAPPSTKPHRDTATPIDQLAYDPPATKTSQTRRSTYAAGVKRRKSAVPAVAALMTVALLVVVGLLVFAVNNRNNIQNQNGPEIATDIDPPITSPAPPTTDTPLPPPHTPTPSPAPTPRPAPTPAVSDTVVDAANDRVLFDFEGDSFKGWEVDGNAFGSGPASPQLTPSKSLSGHRGRRVAHSSHGGDRPKGKLISPHFKIDRKYLRVLVAGGPHNADTIVALIVAGKRVHTTTGQTSLAFRQVLWDVTPFRGKQGRLIILDKHSGRWGMIACDHVVLTDKTNGMTPAKPK